MTRVILLTCGHDYPDDILAGLSLRGIVPEAILTARVPGPAARRTVRQLAHGALGRLQRKLESPRAPANPRQARWSGLVRDIIDVGLLNSDDMVASLRDLQPDLLVLAQCGIVKPPSLELPRLGTLNAHPALLPWVRGVGVVEHSLLNGFPIGITAHHVDPGIDTGAVIRRELIPVTDIDTLETLRAKTVRRNKELLVELTHQAVQSGDALPAVPQTQHAPCYRRATPEQTQAANALVTDGTAHRLYTRWFEAAAGSNRLPGTFAIPTG